MRTFPSMVGGRVGVALVSVAAFAGCQVLFGVDLPAETGGDGPGGNATAGAGAFEGGDAGDGRAGSTGSQQGSGGRGGSTNAGSAGASGDNGSGGVSGSAGAPVLVDKEEARSGTRLKAVRYKGADGSEQPTPLWFDTALDAQCTFKTAADGKLRCLPPTTVTTQISYPYPDDHGNFADAGCMVPVIVRNACDPNRYATHSTAAISCLIGPRIYDRGQTVSFYYYKINSESTCDGPYGISSSEIAHVIVEVPPSEFVEAEVITLP